MDEQKEQRRQRWRSVFTGFVDEARSIVRRHDPLEVMAQTDQFEYELVARDIIPRLVAARSPRAVCAELAEICAFWYGDEAARTREAGRRMEPLAADLWAAWTRHRDALRPPFDEPPGWWENLR